MYNKSLLEEVFKLCIDGIFAGKSWPECQDHPVHVGLFIDAAFFRILNSCRDIAHEKNCYKDNVPYMAFPLDLIDPGKKT